MATLLVLFVLVVVVVAVDVGTRPSRDGSRSPYGSDRKCAPRTIARSAHLEHLTEQG
jgi:hypothetical protein